MITIKDITLHNCHNYLLEEPDEQLRKEITDLMAVNTVLSWQILSDRMDYHLRFGTAGLRAKMEAGYQRLNLVTLFRFGFSLGQQLLSLPKKSVVIGFDARKYSEDFAKDLADILRLMDVDSYLFNTMTPTPLCAYATKILGCNFGVMITASHNPADDNGIKVYRQSSAQASGEILIHLEKGIVNAMRRDQFFKNADGKGSVTMIGDEIFKQYLFDIKSTKFFPTANFRRDTPVVYTPLHGVGYQLFKRALDEEGFSNLVIVAEQVKPDSKFTTVNFPNPEEEHTLDLAHDLAQKTSCSYVIAHDPDADRLQVSCVDETGSMRKLSGNQIGIILAYFSIMRALEQGKNAKVASSIVSSRLLKTMCNKLNVRYVDALTGFANIVDAITRKELSDYQLIFGYEEALGYLIGDIVLDKDGISAGVRFMEIIAHVEHLGKTLWQLLDEIAKKFGLMSNDSWSLRFTGPLCKRDMQEFMTKIREVSIEKIALALGASECKKFDLIDDCKDAAYMGLSADVIIFESCQARLVVRPSGTEPKIKFYVEVFETEFDERMIVIHRANLSAKLAKLRTDVESMFM